MSNRLRIAWLADGERLHLQDGPTDLIIRAFGEPPQIARAYECAIARMRNVLDELCDELPILRRPAPQTPAGIVARRMSEAVRPFSTTRFITPMAAVAGAVADEILAAMLEAGPLSRAFVNNGGDIALHLNHGERFTAGMVNRPDLPSIAGTVTIDADSQSRGIATSGWRGRSHSLGIADAVTVTAQNAAAADAAATMIANAVDLPGHAEIRRVPATSLSPVSDLGERLVTVGVGALSTTSCIIALGRGVIRAEELIARGLINAAALFLGNESRMVCALPSNMEMHIA
ncbi:MAG: UPF0280 family protein [Acidocella sp.]|nr:UPF0280 family protein [Acidocella sp.]